MYYEVHGSGKPLILLHGGIAASEVFGASVGELAKGRQVIASHMQGHGRTVALTWAATLASRVVGRVPFRDMFGAFEMRNVGIEESREMYGLLIIAAWMAVLALRARPLRAQALVATPREITQRA